MTPQLGPVPHNNSPVIDPALLHSELKIFIVTKKILDIDSRQGLNGIHNFCLLHSLPHVFFRIFANIIYFLLSPYLYLKVLAFVLVWEKLILKHKDIKENNLFLDI